MQQEIPLLQIAMTPGQTGHRKQGDGRENEERGQMASHMRPV